jgi:hypothetical protein
MYNIYRNDRAPNTKDKSHGGVLLPITKDFISSEITELKTNCEIVWVDVSYGLQLYQAVGGVVLHLVFQL